MTRTTNAENLRQYKSIFSRIVEQILAFASREVREVKELSPNFKKKIKKMHNDVLRYSKDV